MNKEIFVKKLMNLAPSFADMKMLNLEDAFINQYRGHYFCREKNELINIYFNDELLKLLLTYNCSKVQIGSISFLNDVIEHEYYFEIGEVEQDMLAINKVSMEVEVLDYDRPAHVIWPCASNGVNFLQAVFSAADFLTSNLKIYPSDPDSASVLGAVKKCAREAGGDKYIDFYKILLGYFD